MAGGPQHIIKIMATQTRFDLNNAIQEWRNDLAAQPQLLPDDRRELEKHLTDVMAELRQRGLSDEESFWLARRRIGPPQQLAEEFQKADPNKVWRERVFWMALAFLFFVLWTSLLDVIPFHGSWIGFVCLTYLPPICLAILLARGKLNINRYISGSVFKDRRFFAGSTIAFLLVTHGVQTWEFYVYVVAGMRPYAPSRGFWVNQIQALAFSLMILALVVWLMPKQERQTEKPA
jgi:hypothetical protein